MKLMFKRTSLTILYPVRVSSPLLSGIYLEVVDPKNVEHQFEFTKGSNANREHVSRTAKCI